MVHMKHPQVDDDYKERVGVDLVFPLQDIPQTKSKG